MSNPKLRPLLVIEDDPGLQKQLRWSFQGYDVTVAGDRETALDKLRGIAPAVVTLDLGLPPDPANATEGLALLQEIQKIAPHAKVIVVTGNDDRENALKAVGLGAYDFYQKPIDPDVLALIIDRAYGLYELEKDYRKLQLSQPSTVLKGIIAASPQMLKVCRTIEKVAPTNITTLLLGESGTGKEIIARAIHNLSTRADKPFVAINSAAIPETLLESELFGYEKGAFTGAIKQTPGKLEYADGGTFFIDEVGDLPPALQAKILRFLQERVIERIGGRKEIPIDVRVVCATHQDLNRLIQEGRFREDLYYRISEIVIEIPPLRDREGDIILLARSILNRLNNEARGKKKNFSEDALNALSRHTWPGNVRELENKVRRAFIISDNNQITAEDLELAHAKVDSAELPSLELREVREKAERSAILEAIARANNNISAAADLLAVSRPTLYDLLKKY
ncbi:MAG: PEP-CTERM-box response regulator transcription factor, partial [Gammaproteobacteria bacterium]|nr:PEP-CTERM-box response regulator transcription factor [Gammaproteobacteria bacterium]